MVYSPGTMPRTVTISSRMGEGIFLPLTMMKSLVPPRSSRSSVRNPASRRRYQAILPTGSCTNMSRSSGWLSGQSMVMMNSAFESILPSVASGLIASRAMKNKKAIPCSALNSITLKGSNGSSRGYRPKSSFMNAFQRGNDAGFGQCDGLRKYPRRRRVEHVVLYLQQDRTDQAGKRRIHRYRHAVAHQAHGGFHHGAVGRIETGDRREHDDEADNGAEQAQLHQRVARECAKAVGAAQPVGERSQQQRLIDAPGRLRFGFYDKIANMIGHQARRQCVSPGRRIGRGWRNRFFGQHE